MDELVKAARCLSDPTRVRVLHLLTQRECCVCEVMDVLGISQVNASRCCNALKEAGFLKMRKDGRWKLFSVQHEGVSPAIRDMLAAVNNAAANDARTVEDRRRLMLARRRSEVANEGKSAQNARLARFQSV